jgi:Transposase DDE domain
MFRDEHKREVWDEIRQHDLRAFRRWLTPGLFTEAARITQISLGRGPLYTVNLVWLGLASALHKGKDFASVLALTMKLLSDAPGFGRTRLGKERTDARRQKSRRGKGQHQQSKHDPYGGDPTTVSEEAFTKARRLMSLEYWLALLLLLTERFEGEHGKLVRFKAFRLLAMDGTSISMANWSRLKSYFGTARGKGKGEGNRRTVQARMVMLQMPLVRLPYRYELAPLSVGETTLAMRLAQHVCRNDLVLIDRGFFSYALFCEIHQRNAYFGIRLKNGLNFKTIGSLSTNDRLVEWTPCQPIMSKWRKQGLKLPSSMKLRVIDYQIPGFRKTAVVTNVLDPERISRDEWVRMIHEKEPARNLQPGLYHRRWEIETTFKEMKVAMKMEGELRSRTPEGIRYEIAGHVVLYLLIRWTIVEAAQKHGPSPLAISFTDALGEILDMSQTLLTATPERIRTVLLPRLLERIASHFVPTRPGRHFPRPNDTKPKNKGYGRIQQPTKLARKHG